MSVAMTSALGVTAQVSPSPISGASMAGHRRSCIPLGKTSPRRPTADGWKAACKCGWSSGRCGTRLEAEAAYVEHRESAKPICGKCGEAKTLRDMSKGSPHLCKPCRNAQTRAWAEANPNEWERHARRSHLKRRYGITEEDYDRLLAAQGGACAICRVRAEDSRGFRPHIDHCHKSGRVRGILCGMCNKGIGNLRDDPEILRNAIAYLLAHQEGK